MKEGTFEPIYFTNMFALMKGLFILGLYFLLSTPLLAQDTVQQVVQGRRNSPQTINKPYLIIISADGFRWDYARKYNCANLLALAAKGVEAKSMQPVYPSLTFPNHYSIITGMYPTHHGLVDNSFYDRKKQRIYAVGNKKEVRDSSWYYGIPLWELAERNGMLSASSYWVGSESRINGIGPTYFYNYNEAIPIERRIEVLQEWLLLPEDKRPHLISFYFPQVDHYSHLHGVDSKQAIDAVKLVDESVGKIVSTCTKTGLPINFIFVSDHGMTNTDTANALPMPIQIDTARFIVPRGDALVHIYSKSGDRTEIRKLYKNLKKNAAKFAVYLPKKTPKHWHYRAASDHHNRLGDILLVPQPPLMFSFTGRTTIGKHGYDIHNSDMQASFYAWGPAFRKGLTIPSFSNVHVYPMAAELLGLPVSHSIDGRLKVLKSILNSP